MLDVTRFTCPVCQQPFLEDDDVVVCPVCGAPHHRACYHQRGNCARSADHGGPAQWKPKPEKDEDGTVVCGNCGTVNEEGAGVCRKCGHVLEEIFPPAPEQRQPPVDASVFYAQFSPYIGIAPDSTMDGFPAIDVATFLGPNSGFYLSRFHFMRMQKGKMSWNWAAAVFPALWALYRKMYRLFALLAAVTLLLAVPSVWITVNLLLTVLTDAAAMQQLAAGSLPQIPSPGWLLVAANAAGTGSFILRAFMASMGNHLYHKHTVRHMNKIRQAGMEPLCYRYALSKKGGVALAKVAAAVVLLTLLCIGALSALVLLI